MYRQLAGRVGRVGRVEASHPADGGRCLQGRPLGEPGRWCPRAAHSGWPISGEGSLKGVDDCVHTRPVLLRWYGARRARVRARCPPCCRAGTRLAARHQWLQLWLQLNRIQVRSGSSAAIRQTVKALLSALSRTMAYLCERSHDGLAVWGRSTPSGNPLFNLTAASRRHEVGRRWFSSVTHYLSRKPAAPPSTGRSRCSFRRRCGTRQRCSGPISGAIAGTGELVPVSLERRISRA
jgi:hypothetical protein